ncbi:MAG: hypothetical protein LBL13_07625 [Bacteroidales bacterium]|jgi:hypothetical protein|nr:hypothetical protein [Bacteroidales bacterium]
MNVFCFKLDLDSEYKGYHINYEKYEDLEVVEDAFLFDPKPIKSCWQPLDLKWIDEKPYYDDDSDELVYPTPETLEGDISKCWTLSGGILFSKHAVTVLEPHLQNKVEFLPMRLQQNEFLYVMRVLTTFNLEYILDMDKSIIKWELQTQREKELRKPKYIDSSARFVPYFHEDMLNDVLIFKTEPRRLFDIYVTDDFVDIVNKNKLTGAKFDKIYPPPDPNDIRRAAYEKAMRKRKKK